MQRHRSTGSVAPGQMGGHKPKKLVGAHRDWLLLRCQGGGFTLRGLVTGAGRNGRSAERRLSNAQRVKEDTVSARRFSSTRPTADFRHREPHCRLMAVSGHYFAHCRQTD
jgi:hypothetical protein